METCHIYTVGGKEGKQGKNTTAVDFVAAPSYVTPKGYLEKDVKSVILGESDMLFAQAWVVFSVCI